MKSELNSIQTTRKMRGKLTGLCVSAVVSFSTGVLADDTEVFYGQSTAQANVLFIVDTSGSMQNKDGGDTTRLQRLQAALNDLVTTTNDINVGLYSFSGDNGIGKKMHQEVRPITENRAEMVASINSLYHDGGTPTIAALYDGARYFRGNLDTFASPMQSACQTNHIVLLTDGNPTKDEAAVSATEELIYPVTPDPLDPTTGCAHISVGTNTNESGTCGQELAAWLSSTDHSGVLADTNNIVTHTIGFNFSEPWLESVSKAAGGRHFPAETAKDLIAAFDSILETASDGSNYFAPPAITLDQFTRFSNRDDMYLSLFQPNSTQRWGGNLKRYRFDGGVKDLANKDAVDPTTGTFDVDAQSWWPDGTTQADGFNVTAGGAAHQLDADDRTVLTNNGSSPNLIALHESTGAITAGILGVAAEERDNLLQWARGVDVDDVDEDPTTTTRFEMGDPLHSRPAILTYGGTETNPDSVVFVGTNEGFLHAVNSEDGKEVFSFMPQELLGNLATYYNNDRTINRLYGIDGDLTLWVNDKNNNGILSGTDEHAYLYMGMRRGGNQYYALDVTSKDSPAFKWQIPNSSGDFSKLGQTWSKPTKSKVTIGGITSDVLIFAGGYNPMQDNATIRSEDSVGNDIFIVDAETGDLIWNTGLAANPADFDLMKYSIPSDPKVIDLNGDGIVDQIYIGDMGGQVWRFDIDNKTTAVADLVKGGVIADLSGPTDAGNRRFFYRPDVAIIDGGNERFLSISIGSGNRAHPLRDMVVANRFYMIRQESITEAPEGYGMIDEENSTDEITVYRPIEEDDLYDTTANLIGSTDAHIRDDAALLLAKKEGWLLQMNTNGEKVLASSLKIGRAHV